MPYWNGKLLNAALPATAEPGTPLKLPATSGNWAPLLGARSPTAALETSWHVPQKSRDRWNFEGRAECGGLASKKGPSFSLPAYIEDIPEPKYPIGLSPPELAMNGAFITPRISELSGFVELVAIVALDALGVLGAAQAAAVGRRRPSRKPATRGMAAQAQVARAVEVLLGDRQRRPEDRVAPGVGHHAALPVVHRLDGGVIAAVAVVALGKRFEVADFLRLRAGLLDVRRNDQRRDGRAYGDQNDEHQHDSTAAPERRTYLRSFICLRREIPREMLGQEPSPVGWRFRPGRCLQSGRGVRNREISRLTTEIINRNCGFGQLQTGLSRFWLPRNSPLAMPSPLRRPAESPSPLFRDRGVFARTPPPDARPG